METVVSQDGTKIAFDKTGNGPAVILIDGALGSMSFGGSSELAGLLAAQFSVYRYDRRGRGASGDTQPYELEREIEDIEALIDAAGGSANVYGISSGACLALEAAITLGDTVKKLALYEAPYDESECALEAWKTYTKRLMDLVSADRSGDAVVLFMRFVGAPDEMIEGMQRSPMRQGLEAVAHTLPYDAAAIGGDRTVPVERAASVTAQTLVMDGGENLELMPFMHDSAKKLTKAIRGARQRTLKGQRHDVDNKVLAPVLLDFFGEKRAA